jgi:hypothetical protein
VGLIARTAGLGNKHPDSESKQTPGQATRSANSVLVAALPLFA